VDAAVAVPAAAARSKRRTIAQAAREAGVNLETIRYYERIGMIQQPPRRAGGSRFYPDAAVERIRFIKNAQEHGFALKEIEELIAMAEAETSCAEMCARVEAKVHELDERIAALTRLRNHLDRLLAKSPKRGSHTNCEAYACFTKDPAVKCGQAT
jgi:DNA-binding transcriptional MerR regulator